MRSRLLFSAIAGFSLACALWSCAGGSRVETFYLPGGHQLTFVRPVELSGKTCSLSIDFTHNATPDKDVICNFTVLSATSSLRTPRRVYFCFEGRKDTLVVNGLKRLTLDEDAARFTSTLSNAAFTSVMLCGAREDCTVTLVVESSGESGIFTVTSNFRKAMQSAEKTITVQYDSP